MLFNECLEIKETQTQKKTDVTNLYDIMVAMQTADGLYNLLILIVMSLFRIERRYCISCQGK